MSCSLCREQSNARNGNCTVKRVVEHVTVGFEFMDGPGRYLAAGERLLQAGHRVVEGPFG